MCSPLIGVRNYICSRCNSGKDEEDRSIEMLGGDKIKIAEEFCYLGDMLGKDEKARRTVTARINSG